MITRIFILRIPSVVLLAFAFNSIAIAEIGLSDIALDAAKSEVGNPADAVPGVSAVGEAMIENAGGDSGSALIKSLTDTLGITSGQAEGGAGALFELAKEKMGAESFQGIADVVPGMDALLGAAPKAEPASGMLGNLGGIGGDTMASGMKAVSVVNDFQQLGLSSDMVGKFVPVMVDYVKNQGGEALAGQLAGALVGL